MLGRDAAPLFSRYAELLADEAADLGALDGELDAAIAAVEAERAALCVELAKVYLPALGATELAEAERRTGFRGFSQRKPLDVLPREEKNLKAKLAKLEADERWARREALVGPNGRYTRELAEAKDLLEPWERDCARFEDLEGFTELVEIGYDTPRFEERWWQPSYWRHWAQGDRICGALGLADFGDDVLPAWQKVAEPRDKWRTEVARISQNIAAVHDHLRERDQVAWRLANLPGIYLEECQGVLAKHLARADVPLLASWAGDDRAVVVHLKRLSGLSAKLDMLGEMRTDWLRPAKDTADSTRARFAVKAQKLYRPKKAGVQVTVPAGFEEKVAARAARREKARAYVRRIQRYDAYDRFDLAQPPETWWLHMNDDRRPGVFTPRLAAWYDRNPTIVVVPDPDWHEHRGDAVAATRALAETGDIS